MKDAWSEENDKIEFSSGSQSPITKDHRPSLLAGLTQPPDRSTIVASIPSREAADKLVTRFFESYNPATPARCKLSRYENSHDTHRKIDVLHRATFLKQVYIFITRLIRSQLGG
jgi:hypothetical protein